MHLQGLRHAEAVEAPQPERLERLAQVLVPQEVVLEGVEQLVGVRETKLTFCSTEMKFLTSQYIQ